MIPTEILDFVKSSREICERADGSWDEYGATLPVSQGSIAAFIAHARTALPRANEIIEELLKIKSAAEEWLKTSDRMRAMHGRRGFRTVAELLTEILAGRGPGE